MATALPHPCAGGCGKLLPRGMSRCRFCQGKLALTLADALATAVEVWEQAAEGVKHAARAYRAARQR